MSRPTMRRWISSPGRVRRWLVSLLPVDVREDHGREIEQILNAQYAELPPRRGARITCWLTAVLDVLAVAPRQHAETLVRDMQYALRGFRRAPWFAVAAVGTIALGIGLTTGVFAVINAVLLRPLPYVDPANVALIWAAGPDSVRTWLSAPKVDEIGRRSSALERVAGLMDLRMPSTGQGAPEELDVVAASASFFPLLGMHAHIGQLLRPADDADNSPRVLVLSHGLWMRRFGGAPGVLGSSVMLGAQQYTILGVLPANFVFPPPSSVFPATDSVGTTTFAYHGVGTSGALQTATIDGPLADDTVSYAYHELWRSTLRLLQGAGTTLTFDALGRLATLTHAIGTFTYAYDGTTSRLAALSYPNGQTSTYSYFGNMGDRRLQTIHHETSSSATLSKFDYTYDVVGNILTWRQERTGQTPFVHAFGYDAAEQLVATIKQSPDPTPTNTVAAGVGV